MTTEPLIVASDPNAPEAIELGEDGADYVVTNTLDPAVAERAIRALAHTYDPETRSEVLDRLSQPSTTFTPGTFWWAAENHIDGAELRDVTKELPPAPFHGVLVTLDWLD